MKTRIKSQIMDDAALNRALMRITHEILEKNNGADRLCLVGITTRGAPLAKRIAANVKSIEGIELPVGSIDITLHRDDLPSYGTPIVSGSDVPFSVEGKRIILVDDVLFTGRTVRAAIEALFKLGRPDAIRLAVMIDRGHRELPIRADYVGKNVPTSRSETVSVKIIELDGCDGAELCEVLTDQK